MLAQGFAPHTRSGMPMPQLSVGGAVQIRDFRKTVRSESGKRDCQQPGFAPTVLCGCLIFINNGGTSVLPNWNAFLAIAAKQTIVMLLYIYEN